MSNSLLYIDINKAAAELCRRRLSFFVKEFWSAVIAEEMVWGEHMTVLCDEVQAVYERVFLRQNKAYDLVINIPPGTSKSTIVTIMAPAWGWTRDPSLRFITGSYSDSLATEHSVKSRDIVESDRYKLYFPEVEIKYDKGRKTNYETTKLGQRYATSVGGTVTGIHGHIITVDDPLNPKQAGSQTECQTANDWFDKTLSQRKVNKEMTPTILVMQRLATNDCTGHLLSKNKGNLRHVCLPAEISDHVKPSEYKRIYTSGLLDPKRLSQVALDEAKKDLGSEGYAGQMSQTPVPDGGLIWQKWFRPIADEDFPSMDKATGYGNDWDLAYTKEEANAASAYVSSGKINGQVYINDLDWKWLEFPELIHWMKSIKGAHYIEAKASGKSAKQTLSQQGVIAVEVKVKGGADKITRAKMATPIAEAGMVFIRKSLLDKLYNDPKQGILFFPKGQFKDLADALAQALQRHSVKNSFTVSGGGEDEEGTAPEVPARTYVQEVPVVNPLDWIES
jgi:phage terminase large subunit-like protein